MTDQTIACPKCKYEIPLSEALSHQIRQQLEGEVNARLRVEEARLGAEAQRKAEEAFGGKLAAATEELQAKRTLVREMQQKELLLAKEREALREEREQMELAKQRQREEIRGELEGAFRQRQEEGLAKARAEAARQSTEEMQRQLCQAQEDLKQRREQVQQLQAQELTLRREKQELDAARAALELEVQRKLDEQRGAIEQNVKRAAEEAHRLKERAYQDKISKLSEQLTDAQLRLEQGSQELQGEVLEEELIDTLRRAFPYDTFEDVKRGARGADVLQTVRNGHGKGCGRILWESKNARNFDKGWISKLKQDQQASGAELAVLMTRTLPAEIEQFGCVEDVWVTDFGFAVCLCVALRQMLVMVSRERLVAVHQDSLRDVIYQYVTGQEFATRIKMIYRAYQEMQVDLDSEKRAMLRIWKKREKQIGMVLDNVAGMRGELEGMVGGQKVLPAFEPLSLESIGGGEEPLDEE